MNCDCLKDIEKKLLEFWSKPGKTKKQVKSVRVRGVIFTMSGNTRTSNEVEIELEGQKKPMSSFMVHSFCPWCGKSQEEK